MNIRAILASLVAFATGCADIPEPDPNGRIPGKVQDGGIEGCPTGWRARTLPGLTRALCCPPGSTSATCPRLAPAECTGAWPGIACPTAPMLQVGRACATDNPCPQGLTCSDRMGMSGVQFCTRPCTPDRDGGPDECGLAGGTCQPSYAASDAGAPAWACYPRCVLPARGANGEATPLAATCSLGTCAQIPGESMTSSRRGACYPNRS